MTFECNICPRGSFCSNRKIEICEPGRYNPIFGASSYADCIICPIDHFCPFNSTQPIPCPDSTHFYCPKGTVGPPQTYEDRNIWPQKALPIQLYYPYQLYLGHFCLGRNNVPRIARTTESVVQTI